MKFYAFTNIYISDIQRGIQTAHCVSEMYVLTQNTEDKWFSKWARDHKTIMAMQGGNQANLAAIHQELLGFGKPLGLPVVFFNEDDASLGGALTAVAILVPEEHTFKTQTERNLHNYLFKFNFA